MLEVAGRRTGKTVSFPVVVADHQGQRYLVSMLGEDTNWVRNVRAADGRAVLRRGHREVIQLAEVAPGQRAAILRRYLECSPTLNARREPGLISQAAAVHPWRSSSASLPSTPCFTWPHPRRPGLAPQPNLARTEYGRARCELRGAPDWMIYRVNGRCLAAAI